MTIKKRKPAIRGRGPRNKSELLGRLLKKFDTPISATAQAARKRTPQNMRRSLSWYDGQLRLGSISGYADNFDAFNAAGKKLGVFPSRHAAIAAISKNYDAGEKP